MTLTKEPRVYVCSLEEELYFKFLKEINIPPNAFEVNMVERWNENEGELPSEALKYLNLCEELGSVYSLAGFQKAINKNYLNLNNSYIFITSNYS